MTSLSATVYDSSLNNSEHPHFTQPNTPGRSPYKDIGLRRSPAKPLRSTKPVPDYDEFQTLLNSDITTAAEKELASRVVRAAEKLREWCTEIEQWGWSGSFEAQSGNEEPETGQFHGDTEGQEFSGSIPLEQVEAYESRLDTIDDELTFLEVDELKELILGIHIGRSRPSSSYSSASYATNITLYDDFQLFVTETLVHTLPHHARLKHYLKVWTARLAVLAEIPSFLRGSYQFFTILNGAYHPLQYPLGPLAEPSALKDVEKHLITAQKDLGDKVGQLGKQLDRMLDTLEESDDQLPEKWIDKFEADETEYTNWSYEADKKLFQLRMLETALANNHDISTWVSPDADAALAIPQPAEPTTMDQELGGEIDHGVTDVHESFKEASGTSTANHTNGTTGGAPLAATHLVSESEVLAYDPETAILLPKSAEDALPGPSNVGREAISSLPIVADSDTPAGLTDSPGADPETSLAVAGTVAPVMERKQTAEASHVIIEPVQEPEAFTGASMLEPIVSDHVDHTKSGTDTNSVTPVDEAFFQEYSTRMSEGPEEALRKLEGKEALSLEISALGLLTPGDISGEVTSLGAASSPIASGTWPSDEDDAEDEEGRTKGFEAADLSFLNTDPAESTKIHHFVPSFVRRASATSIESFSRDKVSQDSLCG